MTLPPFYRISPRGLRFDFFPEDKDNKTRAVHNKKILILDMPMERVSQCYYKWQVQGQPIQEAFRELPNEQREFLLTGITPTEWDEIFKEEEE